MDRAVALRIDLPFARTFRKKVPATRYFRQALRPCWIAAFIVGSARAGQTLPVFLSDNHAETFGWITRTFDPDDSYQLVLVDAHTDASAAERSEEIREQMRRVPSLEARAARAEEWRQSGRIEAFNWIEPLMPRPLDHVVWFPLKPTADKAVESLDGRLEVEPRSSGSFEGRWTTVDAGGFQTWNPHGRKIILSVDLDAFAGMDVETRNRGFETIWQRAMDWPGLAGVSICVSRPWLANDDEADALVELASDAVLRTRGATLEIDASIDDRPDTSALSKQSAKPLPRWDAAKVSPSIRERWHQLGDRLHLTDRKRPWQPIESDGPRIAPDQGEPDCDEVWRISLTNQPVLRVNAPEDASGKVRWFKLEPSRPAYDLWPDTGLGKSFSASPARWIYETRRSLGESTGFSLAAERWKPSGCGRVRIQAEVETPRGWMPTPVIDVRFTESSGFRAALSECFGMPYVFGVAGVAGGDLTGVESAWGSDCSNFLIHAWRRNGLRIPWGDPGRLRAFLTSKAEHLKTSDSIPITPDEIERGLVIDFGAHVAAVWEDRDPVGRLGGNDLVAHHLGGFPEVLELATLAKGRPEFALRTPRLPEASASVRLAGDVVLAGDDRAVIPDFKRMDADLFLANLEGVPSLKEPERKPRYDFRFPPDRLSWLKEQGVDAVSLANNHAGDAGRDGLVDAMAALRAHGIGFCGAGKDVGAACDPWRVENHGVRIAVFGISIVDALAATEDQPGVAKLPEHAGLLEKALIDAASKGEKVIVLLHAGDEYRHAVNDEQRRWARWLAARGADIIAGAHPHVIQRSETFAGCEILHSLGNAVYPKPLKGADSGELRTIRLQSP